MELLIGMVTVGGIGVLFLVFALGAKGVVRDIRKAQAHDRRKLLDAWRREIANILVWQDPDRYITLYQSLHAEVSAYSAWKPEALQAKFDELCKLYPNYQHFDPISTRLHVLYADARSGKSDKDLEAMFADNTRFQAILCATDPDWRMLAATRDSDLHHLTEYAAQIRDTKFRLRLERAISDYHVWRAGNEMTDVFDYRDTTVRRVSHVAENRYGIHLKDTNEFGLYGFFVSDDGSIYRNYYRSDRTFQEELCLDVLHDVAEDYRNRLRRVPVNSSLGEDE